MLFLVDTPFGTIILFYGQKQSKQCTQVLVFDFNLDGAPDITLWAEDA